MDGKAIPSIAFALFAAASAASAAAPDATLEFVPEKVYVTQKFQGVVRLRVPALPEPNADVNPVYSQRGNGFGMMTMFFDDGTSASVSVPWLTPGEKKPGTIQGDINEMMEAEGNMTFTLNNLQTSDGFGFPKLARFPMTAEKQGSEWIYTFKTPWFTADAAGEVAFEAVEAKLPLIQGVDRFNRIQLKNARLVTNDAKVQILDAPKEGRGKNWCGAITDSFAAEAELSARTCNAGDPLTLSVKITSATDPVRFRMPAPPSTEDFKTDGASVKTDTIDANTRVWTWRIRPLKAGTLEYPALEYRYFNPQTETFEDARTEPFPLQVNAAAQAALGGVADDDGEEWPVPDGLVDGEGWRNVPVVDGRARMKMMIAAIAAPLVFVFGIAFGPILRRAGKMLEKRRVAQSLPRLLKVLRGGGDARAKRVALARFFEVRCGAKGSAVTAADAERLLAGEADEVRREIVDALRELDAETYRGSAAVRGVVAAALCAFAMGADAAGAEFTWKRAYALAARASTPEEFAQAAEAFAKCIDEGADNAEIWQNLAGTRFFAGDYIGAKDAALQAERWNGATSATRHALVAANARLKNNPAAELPLERQLAKPWHALGTEGKLWCGVCAWWCAWMFALARVLRRRRRLRHLVLAVFLLAGGAANAQIAMDAKFVPDKVVAGEKTTLVLSFGVEKDVLIENLKVQGLPENAEWEAGGEMEPTNGMKRIAIDGRVFAPYGKETMLRVTGDQTRRVVQRNFTSSSSQRFMQVVRAPLEVNALPEDGRPEGFSGAVGNGITITQELSRDKVRPGDLVTATYTLEWGDGYVPAEAAPIVDALPEGMKAYEVKEISRSADRAVWQQVMVPQTTNATHTARVRFPYWDIGSGGWKTSEAEEKRLVFTSADEAEKSAESVIVAGADEAVLNEAAVPVRFGPNEKSPVLFSIPAAQAPSTGSGWMRISTGRGAGWIKR
ncbi:MAG: BatD family protein [Kiritimatiellae bacterium]|nr:BatD family protein [Kiritimatiellia bacterium]